MFRNFPLVISFAAIVAAVAALLITIHISNIQSGRANPEMVAFINFPLILQESAVGKNIAAQTKPKQQALQEATQAKFKDLKQEEGDLNKRRSSMSAEEFDQKNKALQQKVVDWNAQMQKRQADLNNSAGAAIKEVQIVLREQLAAIAAEDNIIAILPIEQAFYAQEKLDLTSEAIRRLNTKLSKVEVKFETKDEPGE